MYIYKHCPKRIFTFYSHFIFFVGSKNKMPALTVTQILFTSKLDAVSRLLGGEPIDEIVNRIGSERHKLRRREDFA